MSLLNKMKRWATLLCWASKLKIIFFAGLWNPKVWVPLVYIILANEPIPINWSPSLQHLFPINLQCVLYTVVKMIKLKSNPIIPVLKNAFLAPTSSHATPLLHSAQHHVLWWLTFTPTLLHRSNHHLISQVNIAYPSVHSLSFLLWGVFLDSPLSRSHASPMCSYNNSCFPHCRTSFMLINIY